MFIRCLKDTTNCAIVENNFVNTLKTKSAFFKTKSDFIPISQKQGPFKSR